MEYSDFVNKKATDDFHGESVSYNRFLRKLREFIQAANELDKFKSALFYGKENEASRKTFIDSPFPDNQNTDLLHGLLGMITEAGEMAEIIEHSAGRVNESNINITNLKEELGDSKFFEQLICNALGWAPEEIRNANIRKLNKRYKNSFTQQEALHRNKNEELSAINQNNDTPK